MEASHRQRISVDAAKLMLSLIASAADILEIARVLHTATVYAYGDSSFPAMRCRAVKPYCKLMHCTGTVRRGNTQSFYPRFLNMGS